MNGGFSFDDFLEDLLRDVQLDTPTQAAEWDTADLHKLASEEWHACAQKRLQMAGIPWQGHWTFVRADCNPDLYWCMHPDHAVASLIRESTSGQVYYGERCHDGTWEPVCIKKKPTGTFIQKGQSERERAALEAVKQAMQDQPVPHCLSFLLDSYPAGFPNPDWLDDHQHAYFITEYEEGHNFDWFMAELMISFDEDLPDCRRQLLQTVKEYFRQILKALAVLHDCGFAHVNLKCDKILCKRLSDGSMHCRITDLGSALREDAPDEWMHIRATFEGVAAEVLQILRSADLATQVEPISYQAADMWAVGLLLVLMLTGGMPFLDPDVTGKSSLSIPDEAERKAFVAKRHEQWADAHAAGSAVPFEAESEWLAKLIPDVNEHTSAARLIRRLLHPDPFRRPTVQQALDDDFLQP